MAHIVFMNIPGHGHVNPTLPVVQLLVSQGHEVRYYNTEEFRDKITLTGATFVPYPDPVPTAAEITALLGGSNMVNTTLMLLEMSEHLLPHMLGDLRRDRPDVLIYDSTVLWGYMCAQLLDLPAIASNTLFMFDGTPVRPGLRDLWYILRQALPVFPEMLRRRRRLIQNYGKTIFQKDHLLPLKGDLNLMFTSQALQPPSTEIDSSFRFVGPSINPALRESEDFPFDQLVRRPVIYISMGTIHTAQSDFYRQVFTAFADHPGQFVLSVGRGTDLASLEPIPSNFIVRNFVPQLDVLPHVDLFITHGGINSIHEGLYYGVPLLMIPQQMEQLLNARVVAASGAGVIAGHPPPFAGVTSSDLRITVEQMLAEDRMKQQAQSIRTALHETGGYQHAVEEIDKFVKQTANSNTNLTHAG